MNVEFPTKVISSGGRYAYHDDWETPDTQNVSFEFGKNKMISWEGRSCNKYNVEGAGRGFIIYGDKGTLINLGNDDYKIVDADNKIIKEVKRTGGNTVQIQSAPMVIWIYCILKILWKVSGAIQNLQRQ